MQLAGNLQLPFIDILKDYHHKSGRHTGTRGHWEYKLLMDADVVLRMTLQIFPDRRLIRIGRVIANDQH